MMNNTTKKDLNMEQLMNVPWQVIDRLPVKNLTVICALGMGAAAIGVLTYKVCELIFKS